MELILQHAPFSTLQGELVVADRNPVEQFKMRLLAEALSELNVKVMGISELPPAVWLYAGRESAAFSVGVLRRNAHGVRVEGPLVAQLSAAHSTWTMDEAFARAAVSLKFTEPGSADVDAIVVRDHMVLYRRKHLTWILGAAVGDKNMVSSASLELAAVAAVAIALGATAKSFAAALRRFRASEFAALELCLLDEVMA